LPSSLEHVHRVLSRWCVTAFVLELRSASYDCPEPRRFARGRVCPENNAPDRSATLVKYLKVIGAVAEPGAD
jgi:hypothetical protein